ncbi:hypothetical protein FRC12_015193 [Ceratobasidium sp. 428]|nr:hypothetical protein FRC12_015193 [Ceratobasidium sp. 428]
MTPAPAPDAIFDHFFNPDKRDPAIEKLLYGPEIDPYFVTFDPERVVMPEVGFDSPLHQGCGIIPAAILRGYLISWSVRGGNQGQEALKFHHPVASLSCYARLVSSNSSNGRHQCSIFKYYFGLLSVRSMVHFTSVTILKATNTLAKVMELFKSSPNQDDVFNLCASAALDQATKALANSSSWHKFCGIFSSARFAPDIKTRVSCVEAMLKVFSQSREGLYTLHTRGLLPGCSLMLLAVSAMVPGDANVSQCVSGFVTVLTDMT